MMDFLLDGKVMFPPMPRGLDAAHVDDQQDDADRDDRDDAAVDAQDGGHPPAAGASTRSSGR